MKESHLRKLIREEAKNLLSESASIELVQEVVDQLRTDYPFLGPYEIDEVVKRDGYRIVFYADDGSGGRAMHYITIADIGPSREVDVVLRNGSKVVINSAEDVKPGAVPKVIKNMLLP